MSFRSPRKNEIALTLAPSEWAREFSTRRLRNLGCLFLTLARFAGEGRVRVLCSSSTLFQFKGALRTLGEVIDLHTIPVCEAKISLGTMDLRNSKPEEVS